MTISIQCPIEKYLLKQAIGDPCSISEGFSCTELLWILDGILYQPRKLSWRVRATKPLVVRVESQFNVQFKVRRTGKLYPMLFPNVSDLYHFIPLFLLLLLPFGISLHVVVSSKNIPKTHLRTIVYDPTEVWESGKPQRKDGDIWGCIPSYSQKFKQPQLVDDYMGLS